MPVQQQKNGADCGLFSIAFATSLAFGEDPSNSTCNSAALRPHLIKCLTSGRIAPFPKIEGKRVVRCKPSTHTVEIFCSCRTPWTAQRNSSYDMAQCCMCSEWYHKRCEKITLAVFRENQKTWFCRGCKNRNYFFIKCQKKKKKKKKQIQKTSCDVFYDLRRLARIQNLKKISRGVFLRCSCC